MTTFGQRYEKPFNSVPELINRLHNHGLKIRDPQSAASCIRRLGYYRFTGYAHPFRDHSTRDFHEGISFDAIIGVAEFDAKLRLLVLEAMEDFEIAVRFYVGHLIGRRDPFGHLENGALDPRATVWSAGPAVKPSHQSEWINRYRSDELRAGSEEFVKHFRQKYRSRLPVWAATEVMPWGRLTRLYGLLHPNDRKLIAAKFGYLTDDGTGNESAFNSALEFLRYTRNVCAHHSRFYNRPFDRSLSIPTSSAAPALAHLSARSTRNRAYDALSVLRFLLSHFVPAPRLEDWTSRLRAHLVTFPFGGDVDGFIGAPGEWHLEPLWNSLPQASEGKGRVVDAILAANCVDRKTVYSILTQKNTNSEKKDWLRYLVNQRALIVLDLGSTLYYPVFQFADGNINPVVASFNEILLPELESLFLNREEVALAAIDWWTGSPDSSTHSVTRIESLFRGDPL